MHVHFVNCPRSQAGIELGTDTESTPLRACDCDAVFVPTCESGHRAGLISLPLPGCTPHHIPTTPWRPFLCGCSESFVRALEPYCSQGFVRPTRHQGPGMPATGSSLPSARSIAQALPSRSNPFTYLSRLRTGGVKSEPWRWGLLSLTARSCLKRHVRYRFTGLARRLTLCP